MERVALPAGKGDARTTASAFPSFLFKLSLKRYLSYDVNEIPDLYNEHLNGTIGVAMQVHPGRWLC